MIRVLFCGGGSVGHLAPAKAVWDAIRKKLPAEHISALFVCSVRNEDRKFLKINGLRASSIHAPRIGGMWRLIAFPILFPIACIEALLILLIYRPNVIFSKGGYVSVPVCIIGWVIRRPIVLHESDRIMGKANQICLRFASHLCIGTPQKEIANERIMTKTTIAMTATGNPIRDILTTGTRDGGKRVTGFSGKKPVLLIIGGSQGAQALNEAVWKNLYELITICDVLHLTGKGKMNPSRTHARYWQQELMYEELHNLYAFADLVVSRAGAGVIAELSALSKPAILVPLPDLAHKHQEENAHFLEVAHAVAVIKQHDLDTALVPTVRDLIDNDEKRKNLGDRLHAFAVPDAAQRIANILIETAKK